MDIDLRVIQQNQKSGLRQTDPRAFTAGAQGLIQLGQGLQDVGDAGAKYASAQQALYNDNIVGLGERQFTQDVNETMNVIEFGEVDANGNRTLLDPNDLAPTAVKLLREKQKKVLKNIPAIRRSKFLMKTTAQMQAAQVKAFGLGHTRVLAQARKLDIEFKNDTLALIGNMTPAQRAEVEKTYGQKLARGVITGAYEADEAEKLLRTFQEDAADTVENHKTNVMFAGDYTVEDLDKRSEEIGANLYLNPKEKDARQVALWERAERIQRKRQSALERRARENNDEQMAILSEKMVTDRSDPTKSGSGGSLKLDPSTGRVRVIGAGITQEDLDYAKAHGLNDDKDILQIQKIVNNNEDLQHMGEEDNDIGVGYLKDLEGLEFKALTKNWTDATLSAEIEKLQKKAMTETVGSNDPFTLTSVEMEKINAKATTIIKAFKDEGKRNLKAAKESARQRLRTLFGGSDQFADKYNSKRNELVTDTVIAAHLLIDSGDRWDVAVDKVRKFTTTLEAEGIQEFKAGQFESLLKKAKRGNLTKDDVVILQEMVRRRKIRTGIIKKED
jgi:hypothetical protein